MCNFFKIICLLVIVFAKNYLTSLNRSLMLWSCLHFSFQCSLIKKATEKPEKWTLIEEIGCTYHKTVSDNGQIVPLLHFLYAKRFLCLAGFCLIWRGCFLAECWWQYISHRWHSVSERVIVRLRTQKSVYKQI